MWILNVLLKFLKPCWVLRNILLLQNAHLVLRSPRVSIVDKCYARTPPEFARYLYMYNTVLGVI